MNRHHTVPSLFSFSAALLEAQTEESTLRAVMRTGCEIVDADGCVFVPFGEYVPTLPALEFGRLPVLSDGEWDSVLRHPSTRTECKACAQRSGGPSCVLLRRSLDGRYVRCTPLSMQGREAGLFSFIFSSEVELDEQDETLLAEVIHLGAVALETISARKMNYPVTATDAGSDTPQQIETRAILGERMRLAREIHDGLAQTLAFLKIEVGRAERMLEQGKSDLTARILHDTTRTLSDAYLDARQAIENLRRVPDGELAQWLKQVAEDFESVAGQAVHVDLCHDRDLPTNVKVQMIRIVQEALTNVRKHASATQVILSARETDGRLVVEVRDNGRGFAADSTVGARFGLRGMRERADSIGAEVQVLSQPAQGTTVRLSLGLQTESLK